MGNEFQYAGTVDSDKPYHLKVRYCLWPFLRSDQWFLPRFCLELENQGKELHRGSIEIDIVDSENLNSLAEVSSYKGHFQDVLHHEVTSLKPGKKEKIKFKIESRFLKPGNYLMRVTLNEWIPSDSPIRELRQQLADSNISEEKIKGMEELRINQWQEIGIDPYRRPEGRLKGKQVFDLRFTETIKIHDLSSVSTIYGMFVGSVLAVLIGGLYAIVKLLNSHWDKFLELLKIT